MNIVSIWDGKTVTTSFAIAEDAEYPHTSVIQLIRQYADDFEEFGGRVAFEMRPFENAGGTQTREAAYLNERQVSLLLTFMRNNEILREFKKRLIRAFYKKMQKPKLDYDDPLFVANLITQGAVKIQALKKDKLALGHKVEVVAQEAQINTPKVTFHDRVIAAEDAISVGEAAKIIGTGRNRLLAFMRHIGWVARRNEPYQAKIETGYLNVKNGSWDHPDHGLQQAVTTLVTGKGLAKLQKL